VARAKGFDLEAVETALRAAVLAAGAKVLAGLLAGLGSGRRQAPLVCACGASMRSRGRQPKRLLTMVGQVAFWRSRYRCPACGKTRYPGDDELDVVGTTRSPGVRRMAARAGSRSPFKEARDDLRLYAGVRLSAKDLERVAEGIGGQVEQWDGGERAALVAKGEAVARGEAVAQPQAPSSEAPIPVLYVCYDGTGVPMVPGEVKGRRGKQPDGTAKTREAKLGCVFTQTSTDERRRPVRDPASTSFVGAIEPAEAFGWRLYGEALRRGLPRAQRLVVLGDGARWVWTLAELHFPEAIQIVDVYHAREHIAALCRLLCGEHEEAAVGLRTRWWSDLDQGSVEKIVCEARRRLPRSRQRREPLEHQLAYLQTNAERMRYAAFRARGLFVGSGVVEAGCKTVIGQRLKQSGMEWSVRGANAIIALRSTILSGRFEDFWEARALTA